MSLHRLPVIATWCSGRPTRLRSQGLSLIPTQCRCGSILCFSTSSTARLSFPLMNAGAPRMNSCFPRILGAPITSRKCLNLTLSVLYFFFSCQCLADPNCPRSGDFLRFDANTLFKRDDKYKLQYYTLFIAELGTATLIPVTQTPRNRGASLALWEVSVES